MNENVATSSTFKKADCGMGEPRYALIFRTYFWDEFAKRQFDRACLRALSADKYVLVDETRGPVEGIDAENVFRVTDSNLLEAGYVSAGEGSMQWYSGDVPLYLFYERHPDYDFYIQMEYDVNVHTCIDSLIERLRHDSVDVVALTKGERNEEWPWLATCLDLYSQDEVRHQLICICALSRNALVALSNKRLEHASLFRSGKIQAWPICEGFLASEAAKQGLHLAELSDYGDVIAYDWWPPFLEIDLPQMRDHAFVHPVLDAKRYVPSLFKKPHGIRWLISPTSWLHMKLRRLGPRGYAHALRSQEYRDALRKALSVSTHRLVHKVSSTSRSKRPR